MIMESHTRKQIYGDVNEKYCQDIFLVIGGKFLLTQVSVSPVYRILTFSILNLGLYLKNYSSGDVIGVTKESLEPVLNSHHYLDHKTIERDGGMEDISLRTL